MTYRFIHLSDIHFGQEDKDGTLVTHNLVRDGLLKDAKTFAGAHGRAAKILVTGDTAYGGKSDEYDIATKWLEQLTKECCELETDVLTIPGNHDCDLAAISYQAARLYATLRAETAEEVQATLHAIAKDGEAANPFLPKLAAYRQFASGYGCDFESPERPMWVREFDLPGNTKVRILGLTSVQVSNLDDKVGKLVLGNRQYTFAEEDNVICVVLVHHPLDWFIDKVEAKDIFSANARLIMVGHEHTLNINKSIDVIAEREHLIIRSGATNPPPGEGAYQFTYNWIELSCRETDGKTHLVVRVFPRVWVPKSVRFDADTTRLGGVESREIEIHCPNVRMHKEADNRERSVTAAPARPQNTSELTADEPEATIIGVADEGRIRESPMKAESASFDRLRYLFWRYLDWRQRLKVLVEVDALPETADQQLPQTLERIALEGAQKAGKLPALWDAMMPLIPVEKRADNPFQAKSE